MALSVERDDFRILYIIWALLLELLAGGHSSIYYFRNFQSILAGQTYFQKSRRPWGRYLSGVVRILMFVCVAFFGGGERRVGGWEEEEW